MRNTLVESKAQRWRALATYKDGRECLLYVGISFAQVSENYDEPYFELLDDEERGLVEAIHLQKWFGTPDLGNWVSQRALPIPDNTGMKITTTMPISEAQRRLDDIFGK
jgi:hypothetical protein